MSLELKRLTQLIFPPRCIFCGELLGYDHKTDISVCGSCMGKIGFYREAEMLPYAQYSMLNTDANTGENSGTAFAGCDRYICVCRYSGIIKASLIRYKFHGRAQYYRTYAALMQKKLVEFYSILSSTDMLVSVPLHQKRMKKRGYNQAYLISEQLSRLTGIPERSHIIKRETHSDNQSHISGNIRHRNIKGAFSVCSHDGVPGKRILLIDDIITTGSTINECAAVLKKAGASDVTGFALASGRRRYKTQLIKNTVD
ncbi:MAG: ComF family protein [Eubacteriales bacterium]|nr:ComF family protein [Eubacteriales bacterium]